MIRLHAGDAGGDDRHVGGGDHRIAPARHVAADRIHRDVAVAEDHAGQRLDLQIAHGLLLLLREVAHLRLGEFDVVEVALSHLGDRALDLGRRQFEILRLPVVELLRQLADRGVLLVVDLRQDALDGLANLGVRGLDRACVHSALEEAGHGRLPISRSKRQRTGSCCRGGRSDPVERRQCRQQRRPQFLSRLATRMARIPVRRRRRHGSRCRRANSKGASTSTARPGFRPALDSMSSMTSGSDSAKLASLAAVGREAVCKAYESVFATAPLPQGKYEMVGRTGIVSLGTVRARGPARRRTLRSTG